MIYSTEPRHKTSFKGFKFCPLQKTSAESKDKGFLTSQKG